MGIRTFRRALALSVLLLSLLTIGSMAAGCSSNGDEPVTTTSSGPITTQTATTGATTTSTTESLMTEWDRLLRDNSKVQHELAIYLSQGVEDDDPLMGLYRGLQARTRALTCRKALAERDLDLADAAMLEVYYAMNLGRDVAQGSTGETLADAYGIIETLGSPSRAPDESAALLDRFIESLAPLLDEATGLLASTTT
ncbi:MAG: hypothetical protein GXY46_00635, partial [Actinobacteria bacterium]|nr:hypothetical protein [Actinomycetota bacterium]